ncbi:MULTISPECIES: hypothetical protein [Thermus]|uniref:Sporulation protein Cse60 n=5 Tax=Thermus TaxID=270 RepID=A0A4Y9EWE5_9DEIN|nr:MULTISPECIES: hypothetical protein [Thermus]ADW21096.1 conserved hypothetical protein [Thermus scotoductus SA-01]ETN87687.1 hypothetical protein TNMX_10995 [Thermus sp. NMX2.A1]MBW6395287.1 hypothetical protein [Thermus brevis]QWK23086.1 MAG: hypothetical protein KNN15_06545 [Thermus antranikianii]RTG92726.1 hypothetical protein CSW51_10525 [Thermus scotoductus]
MQGVRFKVITANDPDIFQERLNRFVEELPEDVVLVEVKFSVAEGSSPLFAALVHYKEVEAWKE